MNAAARELHVCRTHPASQCIICIRGDREQEPQQQCSRRSLLAVGRINRCGYIQWPSKNMPFVTIVSHCRHTKTNFSPIQLICCVYKSLESDARNNTKPIAYPLHMSMRLINKIIGCSYYTCTMSCTGYIIPYLHIYMHM